MDGGSVVKPSEYEKIYEHLAAEFPGLGHDVADVLGWAQELGVPVKRKALMADLRERGLLHRQAGVFVARFGKLRTPIRIEPPGYFDSFFGHPADWIR